MEIRNINWTDLFRISKDKLNSFKPEPLILFFAASLFFGFILLLFVDSFFLKIIDYIYIVLNIFLVLLMSSD